MDEAPAWDGGRVFVRDEDRVVVRVEWSCNIGSALLGVLGKWIEVQRKGRIETAGLPLGGHDMNVFSSSRAATTPGPNAAGARAESGEPAAAPTPRAGCGRSTPSFSYRFSLVNEQAISTR